MVSAILLKITVSNTKTYTFQEVKLDFESHFEDFELFWFSKPINSLTGFWIISFVVYCNYSILA